MNKWFKEVTDYILEHLEDYAKVILGAKVTGGRSFHLNPCPFCGHNDAMTLTRGFNGGRCFSCDESDNLIGLAEKVHGETAARQMLGEWSKIPYDPTIVEPKEHSEKKKFVKYQNMCREAVKFYNFALMQNRPVKAINRDGEEESMSPLDFQTKVRKHEKETLKQYQVGYSIGGDALFDHLVSEGYDPQEIRKANKELLWIPRGYFVYPYFDQQGNLIRLNAKAFALHCRGKDKTGGGFHDDCDFVTFDLSKEAKHAHEKGHRHTMNNPNFSRGGKEQTFFRDPRESRKKAKTMLVLVEGENDVLSVEEAIQSFPDSVRKKILVEGIGGNIVDGTFKSEHLRDYEIVYECFDNDEAGEKYHEMLNREMPEVPLKKINLPNQYNDIDEFLKTTTGSHQRFLEFFEDAEPVTTIHHIIQREKNKHHWTIKTRYIQMTYQIDFYKESQRGFEGVLIIFKNGLQSDKKIGNIDKISVHGPELTRLKISLSNELTNYYHDLRWIKDEPQRTFEELIDILRFSKNKETAIKQIAWYIFHSEGNGRVNLVNAMKQKVKDENHVAMILKEVNGFENDEIDPSQNFPRIQVSQSMFPKNGDAYMYFAKFVKDGEVLKRVPCLVSNKREEIRLDLLKRKDPQSLLLINNKYELPIEIETNIVGEVDNLSLQHQYVDKWINNQIAPDKMEPSYIITEIESFIRKIYYTSDDVTKVLAVWIYATYYYTLFRSGFPYLVFTGAKGSGKSTLDTIINLLAFNPTFSVSTTEAALFRSVSIFGGTFILDELETMSDKQKVNDSGLAAVIKAGYADNGRILRVNGDTGNAESFSAFSPKVISNISGIEDVIADRCIFVETHAAPFEKIKDLIEPQVFIGERRNELHSISSRAALSALENFQTVHDIFNEDTRINTGNARLTQIMRPLVTICRLVGGDYEEALMRFYHNIVHEMKKETHLESLEGKLEFILLSISEEVLGITHRRVYTGGQSSYDKRIEVEKGSSHFWVDSLHLKVFAEEMDEEYDYSLKEIHRALRVIMGKKFNFKTDAMSTKLVVTDDNLLRRMNNKKYVHGYKIKMNARRFIPENVEKIKYGTQDEEKDLF